MALTRTTFGKIVESSREAQKVACCLLSFLLGSYGKRIWDALAFVFSPFFGLLTHMLFADDIFLFGSCEEDLRVMMFDTTVMLRHACLEINGSKTLFALEGPSSGKFLGPAAMRRE